MHDVMSLELSEVGLAVGELVFCSRWCNRAPSRRYRCRRWPRCAPPAPLLAAAVGGGAAVAVAAAPVRLGSTAAGAVAAAAASRGRGARRHQRAEDQVNDLVHGSRVSFQAQPKLAPGVPRRHTTERRRVPPRAFPRRLAPGANEALTCLVGSRKHPKDHGSLLTHAVEFGPASMQFIASSNDFTANESRQARLLPVTTLIVNGTLLS